LHVIFCILYDHNSTSKGRRPFPEAHPDHSVS
jgi:hypothetical protein